ncbi:MAG: thiamine pyrophosphate-binding protein [Clostridiales bacterium]|nr:thiamine pyrophosphate-binding protein [Clostridiales bacterium]
MEIRVADYIADFFIKNGITDIFSVTGGGAMHLNDAFGNKKGLKVTYNHHEQACSIAAEGYARAFNKLPAVCVTTGPGGTNAITGVMGSWLDSIPMFVVSGQVKYSACIASCPSIPLRQLGDQEFNILDSVRCMTKYCHMVVEPESIRYHLEKALHIALKGRQGPVWLDIPLNVQAAKIDPDKLLGYDESENPEILPPPVDKTQLEDLLDRLYKAKKPVILVGEATRMVGMQKELLELIDKLKVPVVTAWNAHDLVPDKNPYYCGRPGTVGTRGGNINLQNSDFLLSLGCRMNLRQISYNYENFAKNAYLAAVDIDKAELDKPTINVKMKIHADIRDVYKALLSMDYSPNPNHKDWVKHCREVDKKYPATLKEYYEKSSPINPYVFMKELGEVLPENQYVVSGNGSACVCSFQAMEIKNGQRLFTNSGCASMGYGVPAAVGCAVALENKKSVVCLDGDGSIQMNIQELQTIRHNNLNVKLFWLNNDGYHSIRQTQTNLFKGNFCGINKDSGISFPEAEKIAYAYGIKFFRIDSVEGIKEKISEVLNSDGPVICEVVLDKTQFFAPKLSSKVYPDGKIVSPSLEDMFPFLSEDELKESMTF